MQNRPFTGRLKSKVQGQYKNMMLDKIVTGVITAI